MYCIILDSKQKRKKNKKNLVVFYVGRDQIYIGNTVIPASGQVGQRPPCPVWGTVGQLAIVRSWVEPREWRFVRLGGVGVSPSGHSVFQRVSTDAAGRWCMRHAGCTRAPAQSWRKHHSCATISPKPSITPLRNGSTQLTQQRRTKTQ